MSFTMHGKLYQWIIRSLGRHFFVESVHVVGGPNIYLALYVYTRYIDTDCCVARRQAGRGGTIRKGAVVKLHRGMHKETFGRSSSRTSKLMPATRIQHVSP